MVTIKSKKDIEILKEGGARLASVLNIVSSKIKPGVKTGELEKMANKLIADVGGRPSFLGYRNRYDNQPYPTALCTSINNEIVHAPSLPSRTLHEGDIIGIDIGMEYPYSISRSQAAKHKRPQGLFTDIAATVKVGRVTPEADRLIDVTKRSLDLGIGKVKPGNTLNDIARAIQNYVENNGFSVVRDLVGHGVGYGVHEDPQVYNFVTKTKDGDLVLKPGMVIAIEPMVNAGAFEIAGNKDGFTIMTADGSLSAHFEHTVVVTEKGHIIITS
jgi:methionyl aminopeptidase